MSYVALQASEVGQPLAAGPVGERFDVIAHSPGINGVMAGLYAEALWPKVTQGLAEVAAGRGDGLLHLTRISAQAVRRNLH